MDARLIQSFTKRTKGRNIASSGCVPSVEDDSNDASNQLGAKVPLDLAALLVCVERGQDKLLTRFREDLRVQQEVNQHELRRLTEAVNELRGQVALCREEIVACRKEIVAAGARHGPPSPAADVGSRATQDANGAAADRGDSDHCSPADEVKGSGVAVVGSTEESVEATEEKGEAPSTIQFTKPSSQSSHLQDAHERLKMEKQRLSLAHHPEPPPAGNPFRSPHTRLGQNRARGGGDGRVKWGRPRNGRARGQHRDRRGQPNRNPSDIRHAQNAVQRMMRDLHSRGIFMHDFVCRRLYNSPVVIAHAALVQLFRVVKKRHYDPPSYNFSTLLGKLLTWAFKGQSSPTHDWRCEQCDFHNFKWRMWCHQCGSPPSITHQGRRAPALGSGQQEANAGGSVATLSVVSPSAAGPTESKRQDEDASEQRPSPHAAAKSQKGAASPLEPSPDKKGQGAPACVVIQSSATKSKPIPDAKGPPEPSARVASAAKEAKATLTSASTADNDKKEMRQAQTPRQGENVEALPCSNVNSPAE